ncbi:MAG: GTP cyclohydrolase I FolE [Candidatus Kerfeldbacteria bacterium]|nr:GTP cyclohydrolase I FolE [Candidatus Kerfeldbacteria bacterium]
MNPSQVEQLIQKLLQEIDPQPQREGLVDTPHRVAESYAKLFSGYSIDPSSLLTFFDSEHYDEMITCREIDFYSTCEHHLLPFYGKAHIGYIPSDKIIGLSKLPRVVEVFARRLQNQERLTSDITIFLDQALGAKGIGVVLEATHLCMQARGVEKQNTIVTTSSFRGLFKNNMNTRNEFLSICLNR